MVLIKMLMKAHNYGSKFVASGCVVPGLDLFTLIIFLTSLTPPL